jgi:hypothetical protein
MKDQLMAGIREWIRSNLALLATTTAVGGLILLLLLLRSGSDVNQPTASGPPKMAFYTTDDGASYFPAARQMPPFDHNGKPAVQAFVFEFGDSKSVGYLMRGTPEAVKRLTKAGKDGAAATLGMQPADWEVKRPGGPAWISMADPRAINVVSPQPPAGATGVARLLEP